jgi:hypothetical protein
MTDLEMKKSVETELTWEPSALQWSVAVPVA